MRYIIDAYNLLFRTVAGVEDLQFYRDRLIEDLNSMVGKLNLDVCLVFDAFSQYGAATRTRHNHLDIVFTGEGITADEHIISDLEHHPNPKRVTIVTSDKRLAWEARNHGAKTESVETFLSWLRKRHNKKPSRKPSPPPKPANPPPLMDSDLKYQAIFEQRTEGGNAPVSDYQRWLEHFQRNLDDPD